MRIRTGIGIGLILLSIIGIVSWEGFIRNYINSEERLSVNCDIAAGTVINESQLCTKRVHRTDFIAGSLVPSAAELVVGMEAKTDIRAGQQLITEYFASPEKEDYSKSFFRIPSSWIYSKSGYTTGGNTVDIYCMPDKRRIGTFLVASNETDVELKCSVKEYFRIYDNVQTEGPACLLLVITGTEEIK